MISSVCTKLMNVSFCLLANTGVSMSRSPKENIAYEFILALPYFTRLTWMICKMRSTWQYICVVFFYSCLLCPKQCTVSLFHSHLAFSAGAKSICWEKGEVQRTEPFILKWALQKQDLTIVPDILVWTCL